MDDQNRGRILNSDPGKLGLFRFADAPVAVCETDGKAIRHVRRLGKMTVTETFELPPGMPLLICRVRWQNDGDTPLWTAYAGSGSGIAARWSRELMKGPLIERKKSPIQGDLNGGETRCAWLGGLCRISMESPATGCGVGLSTLLPTPAKVGQGSMVWGCGASGFQCNFIDPVQGQFPFLVKPHGGRDNGFAFLATQTGVSVFRQTVDLWKALQSEKPPALPPPCAVFVGDEAVHAQTMDYDLQLARSADFQSPTDIRVTSSQDHPWYLVPDDRLPVPGRWYWRVRGARDRVLGAWSETRSFTVNNDHAKRPVKRPLTPDAPLFTLEATRVLDYTSFRPDVPADLARYVGIIAEGFEAKSLPVTDFARGMDKLPYALMLRSHWVGLADIEWLCRHVPNFIGIQGGEHLSSLYRDSKDGDMRYHHRLTKICAKYGMIYQEADGTYKDDKWQELMDQQGAFIREYGPWLVLSQKNNIIRRQFYSQSAALGLWLGDVTHHHGAWEDGGFYWQNAGFSGLGVCTGEGTGVLRTMPRIFWTLNCVLGVSRGCGIYSLDDLHDEPLSAMVLHTLRRDGFMFVRPRGDWARMLSKPFSLRAAQITASLDARYGEAQFQLTNVKSEPLAGLTFEDCQPIRGVDDTERPIRWKNVQLDSRLRQPLRLEMKFTGANVYGLRADWQWLDAQGMHMLKDGKPIDHLLEL